MMFYLFFSFNFYHIRAPHILRCDKHNKMFFFAITVVHPFKYFTYNPSELRTTYSPLITSKSIYFEDSIFLKTTYRSVN